MFDAEKLISEVEARPSLFDIKDKDYNDRDVKITLWYEVAGNMYKHWDKMGNREKKDRVVVLQKKWRSLKDAFRRELRSQKKALQGNNPKKRRKYVYFDQMSFMLKNIDTKDLPREDYEANPEEEEDVKPVIRKKSRHSQMVIKQKALMHRRLQANKRAHTEKFLTTSSPSVSSLSINTRRQPEEELDSDKMFLLSLVGHLKKLSPQTNLWARIRITQVLQDAVSINGNQQPILYNGNNLSSEGFPVSSKKHDSSITVDAPPFMEHIIIQPPYQENDSAPSESSNQSDYDVLDAANDDSFEDDKKLIQLKSDD